MGSEPMELAKNISKHTPYPAAAQIKYDGVPISFIREGNKIVPRSRQNEIFESVPHLVNYMDAIIPDTEGARLIAECLVPGEPFKTASGIIRKRTPNDRIIAVVFDGWLTDPNEAYIHRHAEWLGKITDVNRQVCKDQNKLTNIVPITNLGIASKEADIEDLATKAQSVLKDKLEGLMLHDLSKPFRAGKRCHGMARYKPQPTIDLLVTGFEEAVSATGEPLGMLGRVECILRGVEGPVQRIGVGPGKIGHELRRGVWRHYLAAGRDMARMPRLYQMVEVKYMPDKTYDALRQPTVQRFRDDKTEADIYVR